jgi:hypothetical protein
MKTLTPLFSLILILALAGCGPIPQPFKGTSKVTADVAMLDVPSAVGIAVVPVGGVPPDVSATVTAAVARGLEPYEIPAEATAVNAGLGFTLQGAALGLAESDGIMGGNILWTLKSRAGRETGVYMQTIQVPLTDWRSGAGDSLAHLGAEAAAGIAAIIEGSTRAAAGGSTVPAATAGAAAPPPLRISVKPAEGAPGDGREALQLATLELLLASGAKRDDVNPEVVLMASVGAEPAAGNQQFVTITWRAIAQDGQDLGNVTLTNTIPQGALDGRWGASAFAIAEAGLPQLLELLAAAPRF